ncbi:MAG TPA: hypothetical protein VMT03_07700 [Polyangia bacterium]|nr:hypothetical protein [Polyangia bacterium]
MPLRPYLRPLLAALALATALIPACVSIDGGAVEISWIVIAEDGRGITDCRCADPAISKVRLVLTGVGGNIDGATPCAGKAQCDFPCQRQTGATAFDIPPTGPGESYAVSVVPVDDGGNEVPNGTMAGMIKVPAPILRQVVNGQPTEVEAFTLVAQCAATCNGSVCAPQ